MAVILRKEKTMNLKTSLIIKGSLIFHASVDSVVKKPVGFGGTTKGFTKFILSTAQCLITCCWYRGLWGVPPMALHLAPAYDQPHLRLGKGKHPDRLG